jgi:hypothetical protein
MRPCQIDQTFALLVARPTSSSFPSTHSSFAFGAATAIFMNYRKAGVAAFVCSACRIQQALSVPSFPRRRSLRDHSGNRDRGCGGQDLRLCRKEDAEGKESRGSLKASLSDTRRKELPMMNVRFKKKSEIFDVAVTAIGGLVSVGTMLYAAAHFGEAWPELVLNLFYLHRLSGDDGHVLF